MIVFSMIDTDLALKISLFKGFHEIIPFLVCFAQDNISWIDLLFKVPSVPFGSLFSVNPISPLYFDNVFPGDYSLSGR